MLETAECPVGVAKDIIGHSKTDMTFGVYSGETRMDHRARWLVKAVNYPPFTNVHHPESDRRESLDAVQLLPEPPPSD
jgi:hypothetical protein